VSREIGAVSAEALASIRLGEATRARGELSEGDALLTDGVVISAWSPISVHLQPLAYAALLRATDDADLGLERLDDAEAQLRGEGMCMYCGMAFRVAGAIAAARASQAERAAALLSAAEGAVVLWRAGPWLDAAREAFLALGRQLDADRVAARLAGLG
jgi:hypothetical protein